VIRVVVAGPGADGHDRSAADAVARDLRDAGMEVVRTHDAAAPAVVRSCVQEDAAAVCVPGAALATTVREALAAEGAADVLVIDVDGERVAAVIAERLGR
jgi:methylmalonyl-CoA mutase cobalamin-binding domain/chain